MVGSPITESRRAASVAGPGLRRARSARGVAVAVAMTVAGACTPFHTALAEFDSVTSRDDAEREPDEIRYRDRPMRLAWPLRQIEGTPIYTLITSALDVEPEPTAVENPAGFARERLEILALRAGEHLDRVAVAASRFLWVLDLDPHPLNRITAIRGLEAMMATLRIDPRDMVPPDPDVTTPEKVGGWLEVLTRGWPTTRTEELAAAQRQVYVEALGALSARCLPSRTEQRALIRALETALRAESDPALVAPTREALRRSLLHGTSRGMLEALDSGHADVREAAIRALHRLMGPPGVPFVLYHIAKPRDMVAADANRYDNAPMVRLTLVRICGQLRGELALASYRRGPFAAEYLYDTVVGDADEGLRKVALEALAYCLSRPVDFDPAWAQRWWESYVPSREPGS